MRLPRSTRPFQVNRLKISHLRLITALADTGSIQAAADNLLISQPAASRQAAEIEKIIGREIHRRAGKGIELTEAGRALAYRARRALQEIDDAGREIQELGEGITGQVNLGAVTGPAIEHILPVLQTARKAMPGIKIAVEVATSDVLGNLLLDGRLDFMLARRPPDHQPSLFSERPITSEPLCLIVGKKHPLLQKTQATTVDLLNFDWVLPVEGTLLHRTLEDALRQRGLSLPDQIYHTSSFLLTMALVQKSNAIAPIADAVARVFAADSGGPLRVLNSDLNVSVETFSMIKRADQMFTPAAQAIYDMTLQHLKAHIQA